MGKLHHSASSCCTESQGPWLQLTVCWWDVKQAEDELLLIARSCLRMGGGTSILLLLAKWPWQHMVTGSKWKPGQLSQQFCWELACLGFCHHKVLLEPPRLISQSDWEKRTTSFMQRRRRGCVCCVTHPRATLQHIALCHFLPGTPVSSPSLGLYIEPYIKNALPLPASLFNHPVKELQLMLKCL